MIKGCQKKVIQIKSPKSEIFEEAYFILKDTEEESDECDIVREAERLLEACHERETSHSRFRLGADELLFFLAGILLSGLFWGVLQLFL